MQTAGGQPGAEPGGRNPELLPWVLMPGELCLGDTHCKTSAALMSAPLLLSTDVRFYQEMAARRSVFLKQEGLGTGLLLPVNTHLFNGWRWE